MDEDSGYSSPNSGYSQSTGYRAPPNCLAASDQSPIPKYRIDLSLPPAERYLKLSTDFALRLQNIYSALEDLLYCVTSRSWIHGCIIRMARLIFRKVHDIEEMEELRSIAKTANVDLFLLIVFNVLMDFLIGCTSGGVLTEEKLQGGAGSSRKMLHFRSLDWQMEELRDLLVVLEFVRSKSDEPERVVARSISYAGFVGVLTGVREGLSISLNARLNPDPPRWCLYYHQLLVAFGRRPTISSILRTTLLSNLNSSQKPSDWPVLSQVAAKLSTTYSIPCYLILSDGTTTICVSKYLCSATLQSSSTFLLQTNHDHDAAQSDEDPGFLGFLKLSDELREGIAGKWNALVKEYNDKQTLKQSKEITTCGAGLANSAANTETPAKALCIDQDTVEEWMRDYPTMSYLTHFVCILDPEAGTIRMVERGYWVLDYYDSDEDEIEEWPHSEGTVGVYGSGRAGKLDIVAPRTRDEGEKVKSLDFMHYVLR